MYLYPSAEESALPQDMYRRLVSTGASQVSKWLHGAHITYWCLPHCVTCFEGHMSVSNYNKFFIFDHIDIYFAACNG